MRLMRLRGLNLSRSNGCDEVVDGPFVIEADLGLDPGQLLSEAQLVDQVHHVGIALEQMMVAALEAAVTNVECRGLSPYERSGFIDLHGVALLKQLVGCGEAPLPRPLSHLFSILRISFYRYPTPGACARSGGTASHQLHQRAVFKPQIHYARYDNRKPQHTT